MFPGIGEARERSVIKNSGGSLKGPMQHLPWGDKVLLEKAFLIFPNSSRTHKLYFPGTIFRPNRELARRTVEASTHLIYEGVFAAECGAKHAVINYGARAKGKYTEVADLETTVKTLREYVVFLLHQGPHFAHVLNDLCVGMDKLAEEYSWKIDEKKKQAAIDMVRGLLERDSLGRKNHPASAMAMGGAIWNLLERKEAIQWLDMHMDQRAVQTERIIAAHMDLYQQLWDIVGPETAFQQLVEAHTRDIIPQRYTLKSVYEQLETVRLQPFVKNTKHTMRDVAAILGEFPHLGLCREDQEAKQVLVIRLREGVRWVFVLEALQRSIIFPLSFLIDELLRADRAKRKRLGQKKKVRYVPISSKMSPEKFRDLSERIYRFRQRLGKCQDEINGEKILQHPVKDAVLALLDLADLHIQEDDWRKVKTDLDAIAKIL